jgi:hypothetical protein
MACIPFLSFQSIVLLTSTGQTVKPISVFEGTNDVLPPKEVPFWGLIEKFDFTGSVTPKTVKKSVVYGFPAKLAESIKTHISVKPRDMDTKFEP